MLRQSASRRSFSRWYCSLVNRSSSTVCHSSFKTEGRSFFMGIPLIPNFYYCLSDQFEQFSGESQKSGTLASIDNLGRERDISDPDVPGNEVAPFYPVLLSTDL